MSGLKVVEEREVPEQDVQSGDPEKTPPGVTVFRSNRNPIRLQTEQPSEPSSKEGSRESARLLMEARKILNARASAVMAMAGSFILTTVALAQGTTMSLLTAMSFDILVFLPIAWIAYTRK